jgi:hypothetical protein
MKSDKQPNMKKEPSKRGRRPDPDAVLKRKERQRKYHQKYNEVRKARYNSDPEYRAKIIEREREKYREVTGGSTKQIGGNSGQAAQYATGKKMWTEDESIITVATLSVEQMATFLNVTAKILNAWIRSEKFPCPNKRSKCGKRVFTIKEANALSQCLHSGLAGRASFRPTDAEVTEQLFAIFDGLQ